MSGFFVYNMITYPKTLFNDKQTHCLTTSYNFGSLTPILNLTMNKSYKTLIQNLFLLFFLCCCTFVEAQIFKENFNSLPTSYPYPGVPAPINANLSTPQWSNTSGMWSTTAGASGQALLVNTPVSYTHLTLPTKA